MRNYYAIGQIRAAKPNSRTDKTTGAQTHFTEVIVQLEDYDKNGDLVLDTDTITFPISELPKFKESYHKFISIPYIFLNTKSGSYMFPDETMQYQIYDYNPLVPPKKEDKKI